MADKKVIPPSRLEPVVVGSAMSNRFASWCEAITSQVNGIEIETEPEGVLDAPRFSLCANILTDKLYIKTTSAGILTGWHPLNP